MIGVILELIDYVFCLSITHVAFLLEMMTDD